MHTMVNKNVLQKEGKFTNWTHLHVYDLCIKKSQMRQMTKKYMYMLNSQIIKKSTKIHDYRQHHSQLTHITILSYTFSSLPIIQFTFSSLPII